MSTRLIVWDVQHGNGVTVIAPGGRYLWFDAGAGSYENGEEFSPYRHFSGEGVGRRIDLMVLSHPHDDHIEDLENINASKVRRLVVNPWITASRCKLVSSKAYLRYLRLKSAVPLGSPRPMRAYYGEGADRLAVHCFAVQEDIGQNANNYSVVTFLVVGEEVVCLPGDIEEEGWRYLYEKWSLFRALLARTTVLMASHHGRREGWCDLLPKACPGLQLVIVSDSRFSDTSVSSYYTALVEEGVHFGSKEKKLLSTRANGVITLDLYPRRFEVSVKKGV